MSRIGKKVINIPAKTKVDVKDNVVTATGALGTLSYTVPADIKINIENGVMTLSIDESRAKELNAIHGTTRANVFNIIEGVTNGFHKNLEINGLGYRASVAGNKLTLELGFSTLWWWKCPPASPLWLTPRATWWKSKAATNSPWAILPPKSAGSDLPSRTKAAALNIRANILPAKPVRPRQEANNYGY